jgi:hypothetical protein
VSARGGRAVLVGLTLLAGGCPTFDDPYFYREEFEGPYCEGAPCGWGRVAGPDGSARVEDVLPGERALVLEGSGVIVRAEPAVVLAGIGDGVLALDLLARCDFGSTLSVEIGTTNTFTGVTSSYEPTPNVLLTWSEPRPRAVAFEPLGNVLDTIDSITISKSGDGVCEIAAIGLLDQNVAFRR